MYGIWQHRGEAATWETIRLRFFWPHLFLDVQHHVQSCHPCQIRSTMKMHIPITVSTPSTIFVKVYIDIMHMPPAQGYKYIVLARDDLSQYVEGRPLKAPTAKALSKFFWEDLYCRYGAISQVTTNNGPEVQGAFSALMQKVNIPHVTISPYNSQANGVVERGHFILWEALVKACDDNLTQWPQKIPQTLFADQVTTSRVTGFSTFYLVHGVRPVLPFDLAEATFMIDGFKSGMSSEDLLALRICQLERCPEDRERAVETLKEARFKSKEQFERRYAKWMRKEAYQPGDLVLVHNTRIEKELNWKTKPRYLDPFVVEQRTRGGSYVLSEMDGTISCRGIATFRLLPYIARDSRHQWDSNSVSSLFSTTSKAWYCLLCLFFCFLLLFFSISLSSSIRYSTHLCCLLRPPKT